MSTPHHARRRAMLIKVLLVLYVPTFALALVGTRLLAPLFEEWFFPVIDQPTDRAYNIRLEGMDLCWDNLFFKRRVARPIQVSWTIVLRGMNGTPSAFIGASPRRVGGELAPAATFVDLKAGELHNVSWCVRLPTLLFRSATVIANWEYQTHWLDDDNIGDSSISSTPWWGWNVHQSRTPVVYRTSDARP